jgi:signal transduction histidine kinase
MWLTGNDAVNRYDGKMVKVYNLDRYFLNCPNLQQGYGFAEDDEANIYIGSTRGLYIYHRNQDKFTLQKIFNNLSDSTAMPFAFYDGKIWCFNLQYQLATYDVKTKAIKYITRPALDPLVSVHIYDLGVNVFYYHYPFIDRQGTVWIVGNSNIAGYNIKSRNTIYPLNEYITKNKTTFFSSCYDGNKIICGTINSVLEYNIETGDIAEIKELGNKKPGIVINIASNAHFNVFHSEQGIAFVSKDYKKIKWLDNHNKRFINLSFDKSNRLWVCDDVQGLVIFDFHPKLINKEPAGFSDSFHLGNGINSFGELPNGNVLTHNDVVQDKLTKKLSHLPNFASEGLLRFCTDTVRKGLWFFEEKFMSSFQLRKIYFYNRQQKLELVFEPTDIETQGQQKDMQVLPDGRVICSFDKGLFWLNPQTKSLEKINELPQLNPFKINILSNNRIAVSYLNNDMVLASVMPGKPVEVLQKILPGVLSFYIQEDRLRERYWAGTNKGVYLFDKNFVEIKKFDANNGLAGTYIYGLLLDDEGHAYCSHQHGLSRIDGSTYQITNFDKKDGIQDWDYNNRAFYKATDGTLFFGGVSGFNYFNPPLKPYAYYKPEVYVDEILINNNTWLPDSNANSIQEIKLGYKENNISVKAIVKDLANADVRQLIYRIAETDSGWRYLPNNSTILFNSLAPGDYTLQLGTYDKYTNQEIVQKTIHISIAAPFYSKWWFLFLLALIITGLLFWFINRRKLARQKILFQQQMALVMERKKITADLHDDIGATLSSLQINSAVASQLMNKDDKVLVREVLDKIETQTHDLADKIGDIIWSMKPGSEEFMTMSSRIKNFANGILGSTGINYEIKIDTALDTLITDITTRKNIVLITKEAINNAAKYSGASQLVIDLQVMQNTIQLQVTDNGTGFNTNEIKGNGINNMHKRVEELNGVFEILSNPQTGTIVTARIPLVP